jgi:hypothetical protein
MKHQYGRSGRKAVLREVPVNSARERRGRDGKMFARPGAYYAAKQDVRAQH